MVPGRAWALELYPSQQPAKKAQLFVVRSEAGGFPLVIESFDPDQTRWKKVTGFSHFRLALKEIFHAAQTKRIVKLLATGSAFRRQRVRVPTPGGDRAIGPRADEVPRLARPV